MTDLTEQWKKGELPSGFYYTRGGLSKHIYIEYLGEAFFEGNVEVLAPVPSYEEWQELSKQRNQLIRDVNDLAYIQEENQQLKELLSKCLDELAEFNNSYYPETQELFSQITNAIGEKK